MMGGFFSVGIPVGWRSRRKIIKLVRAQHRHSHKGMLMTSAAEVHQHLSDGRFRGRRAQNDWSSLSGSVKWNR